jgi:hypothetical protein
VCPQRHELAFVIKAPEINDSVLNIRAIGSVAVVVGGGGGMVLHMDIFAKEIWVERINAESAKLICGASRTLGR